MKSPPYDSWLRLAPGAQMQIDARVMQEWQKLTRECREIRGNILVKCFEIEFQLDQIISHALFPGQTQQNRDVFDELFLKSSSSSFGRKIELLRKLRVKLPRLTSCVPENLANILNSIREVRNDFAHYPISFDPVGDPPNQSLEAFMVSKRGTFILNSDFLDKWGKAFSEALIAVQVVSKSLRINAEPETNTSPDDNLATSPADSRISEGVSPSGDD